MGSWASQGQATEREPPSSPSSESSCRRTMCGNPTPGMLSSSQSYFPSMASFQLHGTLCPFHRWRNWNSGRWGFARGHTAGCSGLRPVLGPHSWVLHLTDPSPTEERGFLGPEEAGLHHLTELYNRHPLYCSFFKKCLFQKMAILHPWCFRIDFTICFPSYTHTLVRICTRAVCIESINQFAEKWLFKKYWVFQYHSVVLLQGWIQRSKAKKRDAGHTRTRVLC